MNTLSNSWHDFSQNVVAYTLADTNNKNKIIKAAFYAGVIAVIAEWQKSLEENDSKIFDNLLSELDKFANQLQVGDL